MKYIKVVVNSEWFLKREINYSIFLSIAMQVFQSGNCGGMEENMKNRNKILKGKTMSRHKERNKFIECKRGN